VIRKKAEPLDGLLYHESDPRIEEHYTDTAGFTDHLFALCHPLGFRFAPRIRDLADKRIYVLEKGSAYPALVGLVGSTLNVRLIATHWNEILRLTSSIKQGTVTASLILRKLGAYPRKTAWRVPSSSTAWVSLRDRSFENQRYRASGLNLVVAAIVLWNTVYLGRAIHGLREQGQFGRC
jgi:TnpA family transposase